MYITPIYKTLFNCAAVRFDQTLLQTDLTDRYTLIQFELYKWKLSTHDTGVDNLEFTLNSSE